MSRIEKQLTICNRLGLHARAATKLVELANRFDAEVTLISGEKQASAATVLGLLVLETSHGQTITVVSEGPEAGAAMKAIQELIDARFDEEE